MKSRHGCSVIWASSRQLFGDGLPGKVREPEAVNFDEPPSKLLGNIYKKKTGRAYKKISNGKSLFDRLDPNVAYQKCPRLRELLDEMLKLAREAGEVPKIDIPISGVRKWSGAEERSGTDFLLMVRHGQIVYWKMS